MIDKSFNPSGGYFQIMRDSTCNLEVIVEHHRSALRCLEYTHSNKISNYRWKLFVAGLTSSVIEIVDVKHFLTYTEAEAYMIKNGYMHQNGN